MPIIKHGHTEPPVLQKVRDAGFDVFTKGDYNLNIIGVRNLASTRSNLFDDTMHVCCKVDGEWIELVGPATTDPGRYWLQKEDYKACAIMYHPQQCRSAYKVGIHKSYRAIVQRKPVKYWRDGNKDAHLNYTGKIHEGVIGLNLHRSSTKEGGSTVIGAWSAGCQVWQDPEDFYAMMELAYEQLKKGWHRFTYTLIAE